MNKVVGVTPRGDGVTLRVDTPEGDYVLTCDWLIVADGARSPVRTMLGLEAEGQVFRDRFLIADIHMKSDFPPERRFWFDPPFHPNQSALLHRQADDVWRVDFQLGWDADPEEEKKPERILPRLRAMLGERRASSTSNGRASTRSSAGGCSSFATAACCSPATPRISCRRSAPAAPTAASRTPTTSSGS